MSVTTMGLDGATTTVAIASSSAASAALGGGVGVQIVRLRATCKCFIAAGVAPVATTAGMPFGSDLDGVEETETFTIPQGHKIAVIRATQDGTLYVTRGTGY